ncbi:MAG: hypothetical protein OXF41_11840 [bacterium]|nr:hypothetical protein [bacterium]
MFSTLLGEVVEALAPNPMPGRSDALDNGYELAWSPAAEQHPRLTAVLEQLVVTIRQVEW